MNTLPQDTPIASGTGDPLPPYRAPEVRRVRLALEETLATNCKVYSGVGPCHPDYQGSSPRTFQDGS